MVVAGGKNMSKKFRKKLRKLVCLVFAIMICLQSLNVEVMAATTTSKLPITVYTRATGRVYTYKSVNGSYSGYIDGATDQCKILEIYKSGWCKVRYPISKGYKVAYTKTSNFFVNTNFSTTTIRLGSKKTVYRRSDLKKTLGTVYGTDNVIIIGQEKGNTQILYPLDGGGYKCGWIRGSYSGNGDTEAEIQDGWYQIHSAIDYNYVLDVEGASKNNSANVMLYKNHKSYNEAFLIKKQSNGYYTIMALHSNLYLDVEGNAKTSGANVIQYQLNGTSGSDNQLWKIYKTSDGKYRFKSKASGLYLDCNGGIAGNNINVQVWESNSTNAQKFALDECSINGKTYAQTVGQTTGSNSSTNDKIQQIVNYEISQIGVSDYRGNNSVKYNTWYWGRNINGSGYAWCMAFQAYCANQIGVLNTAIPRTASCSTAVSYYKKNGLFHLRGDGYTPKAGDLVFYGRGGSSHVGMIIASPVNGYLQVVEGNVYDSKGNYSVQKFTKNSKRRIDSTYVYGYASPAY